jgi:histidine ammonia-lyase
MEHLLTTAPLQLADVAHMLQPGGTVRLHRDLSARIAHCRAWLESKIATSDAPIYGINTGFGALCNTAIQRSDLAALQHNLVVSHAAGTGRELPDDVVRTMLLLKAVGLAKGYSAVRTDVVERLLWHFNHHVLPIVYEQGSLGASGDLAPLAHLSLPLIGLGEVRHGGRTRLAGEVLREFGLQPLVLQAKEGLALLNGTQFMSAHGVLLCLSANELTTWADLIAAASLEAFDGLPEPFDANVHKVRPHGGQVETAARMRHILRDSRTLHRNKSHVQDPYSFRCIPQVHGASVDALRYVYQVVQTEVNSATDNPTVFPDEGKVLSAGNFHGQPLALAFDFAATALAELGSISERRTYKLVNGLRGLPPFLTPHAGLNSGFMIAQYTAASVVSKNKQLCTPASVDSIDSSNGQEDHVSMGANAAVKALEVMQNLRTVLSIELLCAMQALDLRGDDYPCAPAIRSLHSAFRAGVPYAATDVPLYELMAASARFLQDNNPGQWTK